jgi:hypothetical protein
MNGIPENDNDQPRHVEPIRFKPTDREKHFKAWIGKHYFLVKKWKVIGGILSGFLVFSGGLTSVYLLLEAKAVDASERKIVNILQVKSFADVKDQLEFIKDEEQKLRSSGYVPQIIDLQQSRLFYDDIPVTLGLAGVACDFTVTKDRETILYSKRKFGKRIVAAWYTKVNSNGSDATFPWIDVTPMENQVQLTLQSDPASKGGPTLQIRLHVLYEEPH